MSKNILLINPPFKLDKFLEKDFFKRGQAPLFPFGIAYIASYLKKHGYKIEILDIYANQLSKEIVINELETRNYDIVGISVLVTQYEYVKWLSKAIKNLSNVPVILGNGLATSSDKLVLEKNNSIDFCVRGEGEITFKELIENINDFENVLGITYRDKNGTIVRNEDRPIHKKIDEFPWPAYELFDMKLYMDAKFYETGLFNIREKFSNMKILPLLTSRGCPYSCNFCGKVIPSARLRSIDDIMSEIEFLMDNYHIDGVHFIDELLVVNKKRAIDLSKKLKSLGLYWDCQARVNTVDKELLAVMKDSGCVAIGYGIESGSQKLLDNMNKRTNTTQIVNALQAAKEVDLDVKVQLIFGYPGEDEETLDETIDIFKKVGHPGRTFTFITPIPGTTLYSESIENGLIDDEEEFLIDITRSFDNNIPIINYTNFDHDSMVSIMKNCEEKMFSNYLKHVIVNPNEFLRISKKFGFINTCKSFMKKYLYIQLTKKNL